jgi:transposase
VIWIGVDAHKRLHEAVAISESGVMGSRRITNEPVAWAALLEWARQWPEHVWAVEGAWYLGRGLAQFLAERGEEVHEVNGRWTARRRRGMRRPGKSDRLDAHSVAQLLREERATLPRVYAEDDALASVQLWSRLEAETAEDRTRLLNRLHNLLLLCDPGYARLLPELTTRAGIAAARAYVAPGSRAVAREREAAVRAVAEQVTLLDEQIHALRRKLEHASKDSFRALRAIEGVGPQIACTLIAELGAPRRGFSDEQLAALAGVAPLEASSAGATRHRLNRGGNRRLNLALHRIVLTQARTYEPARLYLARRRAEGRTDREARRALKRLICRRIIQAWRACFDRPLVAAAMIRLT